MAFSKSSSPLALATPLPIEDWVKVSARYQEEKTSSQEIHHLPASPPLSITLERRRFCSRQDCHRVLPLAVHDPHTVCIMCQGFCVETRRCSECAEWDVSEEEKARNYQSKSQQHRVGYATGKGETSGFAGNDPRVLETPSVGAPSLEGALSPKDSVSQAGSRGGGR